MKSTLVAAALPDTHGRGFDELPAEVRELFTGALVASLTRAELLRALGCAVRGLLAEAEEVEDVATKVAPQLERLVAAWNHSPEAARALQRTADQLCD